MSCDPLLNGEDGELTLRDDPNHALARYSVRAAVAPDTGTYERMCAVGSQGLGAHALHDALTARGAHVVELYLRHAPATLDFIETKRYVALFKQRETVAPATGAEEKMMRVASLLHRGNLARRSGRTGEMVALAGWYVFNVAQPCVLQYLCTDPVVRKIGVAERLLAHFYERRRDASPCTHLYLAALKGDAVLERPDTKPFYERNGYEEVVVGGGGGDVQYDGAGTWTAPNGVIIHGDPRETTLMRRRVERVAPAAAAAAAAAVDVYPSRSDDMFEEDGDDEAPSVLQPGASTWPQPPPSPPRDVQDAASDVQRYRAALRGWTAWIRAAHPDARDDLPTLDEIMRDGDSVEYVLGERVSESEARASARAAFIVHAAAMRAGGYCGANGSQSK